MVTKKDLRKSFFSCFKLKEMSDLFPVIWLMPLGTPNNKIPNLPEGMSNVSNPALLTYLEEKYPRRRFLIRGYLSAFLRLLPELLALIASFCSVEKCALLCRTCTSYNTLFLPALYSLTKNSPVSLSEIIKSLEERKRLIICMDFQTGSTVSICEKIDERREYIYPTGSIKYVFDEKDGTAQGSAYGTLIIAINKLKTANRIWVDPVSECTILAQRGSLIRHNPLYISEQITAIYTEKLTRLFQPKLCRNDMKELFISCEMSSFSALGVMGLGYLPVKVCDSRLLLFKHNCLDRIKEAISASVGER